MTKALEDAFKEASTLPAREQDQLAAAIRAEVEAERAWEAKLAASGDALAALADEALLERRSGRTLPLAPTNIEPQDVRSVPLDVRAAAAEGPGPGS